MKQSAWKFSFLMFWLSLIVIAMFATSSSRTSAAPLAAITGTPTEQATHTPTNTPDTSTRTPTATPHRDKPGIADPLVTKSVNVKEARIGDEVTFTIKVTNRGNDTANDVVVTDPIPDYMDVIEATTTRGNVSSNGRTVIVNIGPVAPGEAITIRIRVRVNERAQPPVGRNGVSITTSSPGDDPGNNSSEVTFGIVGEATPSAEPPTATPVPTVAPRRLPRTGTNDSDNELIILGALVGLVAFALSLLMRRLRQY